MVGESCKEFGLATHFKAEVERFSCIEDLLHNFPHLIHFDREHPTVAPFVSGGFDGVGKGLINGPDAVAKKIMKTDEQGIVQTALARPSGHFHQINFCALRNEGPDGHISRCVDSKISAAPAGNSVRVEGTIRRPSFRVFRHRLLYIRRKRRNATIPALFQ